MDDDDFAEVRRVAATESMSVIEALDLAEVQEALAAWSQATFSMIRALERAGIARHTCAGFLGGSIIDALQRLGDEDE